MASTIEDFKEGRARTSEIWRDILGFNQTVTDTHFFDAGGNSLLAIVLAERLEAALGYRVPVSLVYEHPYLSAFCEAIHSLPKEVMWRPIRELAMNHSTDLLFLLVHGLSGDIGRFASLGQALGHAGSVIALNAIHASLQERWTIPSIAEEYLKNLNERVQSSRTIIVGYSGGGAIGHEMAQRWASTNASNPPTLVLLDAGREWDRDVAEISKPVQKISRMGSDHVHEQPSLHFEATEARIVELRQILRDLLQMVAFYFSDGEPFEVRDRHTWPARLRYLAEQFISGSRYLDERLTFMMEFYVALLGHKTGNFDGRCIIVRSSANSAQPTDPTLGWMRYLEREPQIAVIDANHFDMLTSPYVERLATVLVSLA